MEKGFNKIKAKKRGIQVLSDPNSEKSSAERKKGGPILGGLSAVKTQNNEFKCCQR